MTRRISANSLARAYDSNVRSLYRSMQRARQQHRTDDAAFCRDALNCLLQVRKDARDSYIALPNASTVAFREQGAR